jgi:choline dehydrogenase-like flavoprotein
MIKSMEKFGYLEVDDLQSLDSVNGVQRVLRYISPDGKRQDAASTYLHPKLQDGKHPKLHVVVQSQVIRVLIANKKAVGVEYRPNPIFSPDDTKTRTVKARRMVIVSCGACGTPGVLERSGIGSPDVLERAGVPLVADVPGVGYEYEDHELMLYPYKSSLSPDETMDAVLSGRVTVDSLFQNNDPRLGWNVTDTTAKVRPTDEEAASLGPKFQEIWDRDFKHYPDRPVMMMVLVAW